MAKAVRVWDGYSAPPTMVVPPLRRNRARPLGVMVGGGNPAGVARGADSGVSDPDSGWNRKGEKAP